MAATAEDDAVGVDQIDLAGGFYFAEDLGRVAGGIGDFVEGDPLANICAAFGLVEGDGGVFTDVEGLPIEQRLLGGLLDGDLGLAAFDDLRRGLGSGPLGGIGGGHETAGDEAVRNLWQGDGEVVSTALDGGIAGGDLHRPHGVEGARGAGKRVLGIGARGIGGGGSGRTGGSAAGLIRPAAATAEDVASVSVKAADEDGEADILKRCAEDGSCAVAAGFHR